MSYGCKVQLEGEIEGLKAEILDKNYLDRKTNFETLKAEGWKCNINKKKIAEYHVTKEIKDIKRIMKEAKWVQQVMCQVMYQEQEKALEDLIKICGKIIKNLQNIS